MDLSQLINSGSTKVTLTIGQALIVNDKEPSELVYKVSLGRLDFKATEFVLYDDSRQHQISFKQPGNYQLKVKHQTVRNAPTQFEYLLMVEVKEN